MKEVLRTGKRILVAYASRNGSTAEIAGVIGDVLRGQGHDVHVRPVADIEGVKGYQAVVIGSAARIFRLLPEAVRFALVHRNALATVPTAYFMTGLMMKDAGPGRLKKARAILSRLSDIKEPVDTALFTGKLEPARLRQPWRFYFSRLSAVSKGDYRDWDAIRKWAGELGVKF